MQLGKIFILIIFLVIVAGVLGFAIYYSKPVVNAPIVDNTPKEEPKTEPDVSSPLDKNLTADEKSLLSTPKGIVTTEQDQARSALAEKLSVSGNKITVADCVATPIVLKTKIGSTITVSNQGTGDFHFGFEGTSVLVASGKSITYKVNFKTGAGVYGYGCDNKEVTRAIGLVLATP